MALSTIFYLDILYLPLGSLESLKETIISFGLLFNSVELYPHTLIYFFLIHIQR